MVNTVDFRSCAFYHNKKKLSELGVVVHTCNPSTREAEAGGRETLFLKKKKVTGVFDESR
jgi:hypothetical protein